MKLTARFGLITAFVTIPILPNHDWAVWGGDGHRLVCDLAWRQLTPKARALIGELRGDEATIPFANACTWADDIRRDRPETSGYHFVNIPPGVNGIDLSRDCADERKRCAPWAIKHYTKILADSSASRHDRQEALKFVSHFVGDLHQPLHAGRLEDLGGNKVYVNFFGDRGSERSPMQLHRVWDSGLLARAHLRWPAAMRSLLDSIRPEDVTAWSNSDVLGWTNESYQFSEKLVYVQNGSELGETYYNHAIPVVKRRIQQAGVRLAHLLNEAAEGRAIFNF